MHLTDLTKRIQEVLRNENYEFTPFRELGTWCASTDTAYRDWVDMRALQVSPYHGQPICLDNVEKEMRDKIITLELEQ